MTPSPPLRVLTDAHLFQHITSFANGVPYPLYTFWLAHKPDDEAFFLSFFKRNGGVMDKIVAFGTTELLDRATQVYVPREFPYEAWSVLSFDRVVPLALEHHRADMLEWGISSTTTTPSPKRPRPKRPRDEPSALWHDVITNYHDGDVRLLDVLKRLLTLNTDELEELLSWEFTQHAVKSMELVQWLLTQVPDAHIEEHMMFHAVRRGDLEMAQFFYDRGNRNRCDESYFTTVYQAGKLELLTYLLERDLVDVDAFCARAMVESYDGNVHQLVRRFEFLFEGAIRQLVEEYAHGFDTHKLRSLLERGYDLNFSVSIDRAAANGQLDIIALLHEHGVATASTAAMDQAAQQDKWDVVEFLYKHKLGGCTAAAMDAAAAAGRLEYVKLFHEDRPECCTAKTMDGAAAHGHLDVVRFLHENTTAGCTSQAMDAAAKEGHLKVIEFLHTHRSEGCTTDAMDKAAANGRVRIVKYLHTHRSEGCTVAAVKQALANDHREIVKVLWEHYPHLFGPDVLHDVLLYEQFEIFMELRVQYPVEAKAVLSDVMFDAGKLRRLPTIRFVIDHLDGQRVAYRAMEGAVCADPYGHAAWMRAVFAVTGPTSCRLSAVRAFAVQFERKKYYFWRNAEDAIAFLVDACCEDSAREVMLSENDDADLAKILSYATFKPSLLHPFLTDPRAPTWAIQLLGIDYWTDPYYRIQKWTWPVLAADWNDTGVLEIIRDTPGSARPLQDIAGRDLDPVNAARQFSFEGAHVAAVCRGNLPMLQWLIEHVDLPIEPTLLSEAVYYHRYDVALWLAYHCRDACREMKWDVPYVPSLTSCGLDDELLDWLEKHDSVHVLLDFGTIIDKAAEWGDTKSLRTLYKWYPEMLMNRPKLIELASEHLDDPEAHDAVKFLHESENQD